MGTLSLETCGADLDLEVVPSPHVCRRSQKIVLLLLETTGQNSWFRGEHDLQKGCVWMLSQKTYSQKIHTLQSLAANFFWRLPAERWVGGFGKGFIYAGHEPCLQGENTDESNCQQTGENPLRPDIRMIRHGS